MKFLKKSSCFLAAALSVLMTAAALSTTVFAEESSESSGRLEDGSFENLNSFTGSYKQFKPAADAPWRTTAETNLIELFRENKSTYISNVYLKPSDGTYGAELNADEESTLYQVVQTEPSSLYEWGLDHGARTKSETMALIIGPNQPFSPSKNWGEGYESSDLSSQNPTLRTGYKYGRDQMMQMVDWLKATGQIGSTTNNNGLANNGKAIILYSKKFGEHGSFQDNQDNQPFSMQPSSVYTEKWYVWLMTDHYTTTVNAVNPWGSYGLNADHTEGDSFEADLSKYYLYTVPAEQTETLFAFTSVENSVAPGKKFADPTFGNFLDNVNFNLYRSLSGSTTTHGSAVMGSSDGGSSGEGVSDGHEITVDHSLSTYIADGQTLQIQARIASRDRADVTFAGVYYTVQDPSGNGSKTVFLSGKDSELWTITEEESGDIVYSHNLENVTSAVNLHFVFIKSPLITYDPNGGKAYSCTPTGSNHTGEADNVYSFMPQSESNDIAFIEPYTSHAAEGQNDGWKFMGWQLFDDNGAGRLLPGIHSVACNYQQKTGEAVAITQNFVVIGDGGTFTKEEQTVTEASWTTTAEQLYNGSASGLTMVAQWRWRQAFIPQTNMGSGYAESDAGGSVSITSVTDAAGDNYDAAYTEQGAKAYYAGVSETVIAVAEPAEGFSFDGWYDAAGNQVSSRNKLTYVETRGSVNTYYARFSQKLTQTFKRQIQVNGEWITLSDEDTTVPVLDHVSMSEGVGTVVSSTASNNEAFGLIGWFDENGSKAADSMVCNDGKTIRYAVSGNATYYARYAEAVTVNFKMQLVGQDGSLTTLASSNSYGSLSVASVNAIPGDVVTSKAYPAVGYRLVGWYDGDGADAAAVTAVDPTDAKVITPTAADDKEKTYYARFTARTDTLYRVNHHFKKWNEDGTDKLLDSYTYYGVTGEWVTPTITPKLSEREGYVYSSGIVSKQILANGSLVFNLYYTKTYTVLTYNANAPQGSAVSGEVADTNGYVGCGVTVRENAFVVSGYKFNGWNTAADGSGTGYLPGDEYVMLKNEGEDEAVNPNVLYAQWVPESSVSYKVQHICLDKDSNVLKTDEAVYYAAANQIVTAAAKSYLGYTYQADYDKNGMKTTASGTVADDGSLVLKLYYTPDAATLTYKANGGAGADVVRNGVVGETVKAEDGSSFFTRPGYTFNGWKTPAGVAYAAGKDYVLSAGEDILLAQWSANSNTPYQIYHYKVSADGQSAILEKRVDETGRTGASVTVSSIDIEGYSYKSDFNSNGMKGNDSGIIAGDGSLVLNLYYLPNTVKLTYKANGGTGSDVVVDGRVGEIAVIPDSLFSRPGYTFTGWNTEAAPSEGVGTSYAPKDTYIFGAVDGVLYAQWSPNTDTAYAVEHYKVSADETSAVLADRVPGTGTTDGTAVAEAKGYQGYTYMPTFDKNGMKTNASGIIAADGSLVLKLYYTPDVAYLYYYANDDGITTLPVIKPGKVGEGLTVEKNLFSRADYTFTGWNTAADGSGTAYAAGSTYVLTANEDVLYAQWRANAVDTSLTYKANGGVGDDVIQRGKVDETVAVYANTFSRENYTFTGWNTAADGSGTAYAEGGSYTLTAGDDILYAQWKKELETPPEPGSVILTYKANGGIGDDVSDTGLAGAEKTVADNPFSRDGYSFVIWNTKEDGSGTSYAVESSYVLAEEENVLYALWEPIPTETGYTSLTYKNNGGNGKDVVTLGREGSNKTVMGNPFSREGYRFTGWNTSADGSGTPYAAADIYLLTSGEDVLYAQWLPEQETPSEPKETSLTYKANGGLGENRVETGTVGQEKAVADNPFSREGYHFAGWNTAADGSGTAYAPGSKYTLTEGEDILYAQWEVKESESESSSEPSSSSGESESSSEPSSGSGESESSSEPSSGSGESESSSEPSSSSEVPESTTEFSSSTAAPESTSVPTSGSVDPESTTASAESSEPLPETSPIPSQNSGASQSVTEAAKTGDNTNLTLWMILLSISAVTMAVLAIFSRRKQQ